LDPIEAFVNVAQWTRYENIPVSTLEATKKIMIDLFGVMLGGTASRQAAMTAELAQNWGGSPDSTILRTGVKASAPLAVLANCTAGRSLDYDDVHEQAHLHATVAVVPPALALSETTRVTGEDFIVSTVIGFELLARLGLAITVGPGATGMSTTYQGASLATAVVGAKILEFDADMTRNALGIAYSQLAGTQQVIREGVDMMVIQQGISGMSGMIALEMARMGVTGPKEILTGKYGYFPVYHLGRNNIGAFTEGLGDGWEIERTSIKPFPCCKLIHTALQAALDLKEEYSLVVEDIAEVQVGINAEDYEMVCEPLELKRRPKTVVDGIYSVPFVLSVGLNKGRVGLSDFTVKEIKRPDILEFADIITPIKDPDLPKYSEKGIPAWVTISTRDGRELKKYREGVVGSPSMPMSMEEQYEKFLDCARYGGYSEDVCNEIFEALQAIEEMEDLSDLVKLCSRHNVK
jgi:2-methylcitrate dehydratase PrpD